MKKQFTYQGQTFKHGDYVTCEIEGIKIEDARISIDKHGAYICQDIISGENVEEKFGYKHSWLILYQGYFDNSNEEIGFNAENLKLKEKTLDNLEVGDILITKNGYYLKVLGVCGMVYFMSYAYEDINDTNLNSFGVGLTKQELADYGYKPYQPEPTPKPETVEIFGKKYDKEKVKERLKELEEIK